ncbi:ornithine cyclodeaminase family protein [Halomonas salipaludis]|nr:ornithine cyclodeaminase family protein [Halomonas salipaludis]
MPLLLTNDDIAPLLDPLAVINILDQTYSAFALGTGVTAPRLDLQASKNNAGEAYQLGIAAGLSGRYGALRIKSDMTYRREVAGRPRKEKYCVEPGTYCGLILLFSLENGELLAILHDGLIQKMRVGADSALGARYLAREDAAVLGILGAGGMARTHIDTITMIRPIEQVRIYSPTEANREALAVYGRARGLDTKAVESPEAAFDGADIISACTNAVGPVIHGPHLAPGMHITSIGGTLDTHASARVDVALRLGNATAPTEMPDWRFEEECMSFVPDVGKSEAGGTRRFADVPLSRLIMLRELLNAPKRGRCTPEQITFSERGNIHGVQFAGVAGLIYERALAQGLGTPMGSETFLQNIRN